MIFLSKVVRSVERCAKGEGPVFADNGVDIVGQQSDVGPKC